MGKEEDLFKAVRHNDYYKVQVRMKKEGGKIGDEQLERKVQGILRRKKKRESGRKMWCVTKFKVLRVRIGDKRNRKKMQAGVFKKKSVIERRKTRLRK